VSVNKGKECAISIPLIIRIKKEHYTQLYTSSSVTLITANCAAGILMEALMRNTHYISDELFSKLIADFESKTWFNIKEALN
jgi:hypothetical protein